MIANTREDEDFLYFYLHGPYELKAAKRYKASGTPNVSIQREPNSTKEDNDYEFTIMPTPDDDTREVSKYKLTCGKRGSMKRRAKTEGESERFDEVIARVIITRADRIVRTLYEGYKITNRQEEWPEDRRGIIIEFCYDDRNFSITHFPEGLTYNAYIDGEYWMEIEAHSDEEAKDFVLMEYMAD